MTLKPQSIDEYLDLLGPEDREQLQRLRSIVAAKVPEVNETISYGMPTMLYRGKALVYFTASKKHLSFYPSSYAIEELSDRLREYTLTKHAIQFTPAAPLPETLIHDLVSVHQRVIDEQTS